MNGRAHWRIYTVVAIALTPIYIYYHNFKFLPLMILAFSIADPDEDQKWVNGAYHRFFLTHSNVWPALIAAVIAFPTGAIFLPLYYTLSIPTSVHLLCDLAAPGGRHGKWLIRFTRHRTLPPIFSSLWLFINAIIPLFLWVIIG